MSNKFRLVLLSGIIIFGLMSCSSPEEKAKEFYEKGMVLLEQGDLNKAKLEFQNALQIDKKMVGPWYGLALISEEKQQWKNYYKFLNKVVEMDKSHIDAQLKLGRIFLVSNQLEKATDLSAKLIQLDPDKADVLAFHADVLLKLKDFKGAVDYANRALSIDSNSVSALLVLVKERMEFEDFEGANKFVNEGLDKHNNDVSLLIYKAEIAQKNKDAETLGATLKKLYLAQPENREFSELLVKFYLMQGEKKEAEKVLREIVDSDKNDIEALSNLLSFVNTVKGYDAAISEIQTVISENPQNMDFQFLLVDLYLNNKQLDKATEKLETLSRNKSSLDMRVKAREKLASLSLIKKDKEYALKLVEEILQDDPENPHALLIKAADQIYNRQYDEGISNLRTILRVEPNSAPALHLLGQAHELSGDNNLAQDMYSRAFVASKYAANYGLRYSEFLLKQGSQTQAINVLEDALSASTDNQFLLIRLAQFYIANSNWAKAQELTDKISELEKGNESSYQLQGIISAGQKDYDRSIASFKMAYESFPDSTELMASLVRVYVLAGRYDEAEQFLDKVLITKPNNKIAFLLKARLFSAQAKFKLAKSAYLDLIDKHAKDEILYSELSNLYLRLRQIENAVSTLDKGLENNPTNLKLLLAMAGIFEGQRQYEKAIETYEKIVEYHPNSAIAVNNLASLLSNHRSDKESLTRAAELAEPLKNAVTPQFTALETYEKVFEQYPNSAIAVNNLVSLFSDQLSDEESTGAPESEQPLKKAVIPQFVDTLGWIYYKQGKYEEAIELLVKAVSKAPNNIEILFHLGKSYEALLDSDNAQIQYEKILKIAGNRPFSLREKVEDALANLNSTDSDVVSLKEAINQ